MSVATDKAIVPGSVILKTLTVIVAVSEHPKELDAITFIVELSVNEDVVKTFPTASPGAGGVSLIKN